MKLTLINADDAKKSLEVLKKYYDSKIIPAEKKTYLSDLKNSVGPYMGVVGEDGKTHYFLDAASQIATLGHGFNASVFFGTCQFQESWTNDPTTSEFKELRKVFINFLHRKLNWKKTYLTFVHSGAEANETALGYAYRTRFNKMANKVLAFEGSFHGRMMVTLAATWNKSKREPFEWQNYLAEYVPYPEANDGVIHQNFPENWRLIWNDSSKKDFSIPTKWEEEAKFNLTLKKEIEVLKQVREKLLTKQIFAVIVEPMQCEGGDCYSTDRFHTALILLARTFKVPVIHDEVQTGFHLGKEFFWHRQLNMKDVNGEQLNPDYVTCAKKAQIGIVLSHKETKNVFKGEEFSVASCIRGYAHAISLDQAQSRIISMSEKVYPRLIKLLNDYPEHINRPRLNGLAFAFDLADPTLLNKFVDLRFKYGLLYYPAGNQTLRFRLNTNFNDTDLDFLFTQLALIIEELCQSKKNTSVQSIEVNHSLQNNMYDWHSFLIETKIFQLLNPKSSFDKVKEKIQKLMSFNQDYQLIEIGHYNFLDYRESIINLQKTVYEPARQTDIEKFEHTVLNKNSLCLGLLFKNELVGISFAGPLKLYPLERGVRQDPHYQDEDSLYMLDLTIHPTHAHSGLGRSLKYATSAYAITKGIKKIKGRNRDRLAAAMLNINLSLGAIEQDYYKEDYPDFEAHRDVFYYSINAGWKKSKLKLGHFIDMPISIEAIQKDYVENQLPYMVNKICLSNFVSAQFLESINEIFLKLPEDLRHGYTCSGQSECADKVIKSIWVKSSDQVKNSNTNRMITFKNHFFGNGSNLSRSLSYEQDPYFQVHQLDNPNENNFKSVLKDLELELSKAPALAVWIEPVLQKTMEKVPHEFLRELKEICKKFNTALIYNETASQMYHYNSNVYFASSLSDISPDAGMIFTGGQSGLVFTSTQYFLEQPLMLISTWDGDEFSLNTYFKAFKKIESNSSEYIQTMQQFQKKISTYLTQYDLDVLNISNGTGYFKGNLPAQVEKMFKKSVDGRYVIAPSFDAMKEFLKS